MMSFESETWQAYCDEWIKQVTACPTKAHCATFHWLSAGLPECDGFELMIAG